MTVSSKAPTPIEGSDGSAITGNGSGAVKVDGSGVTQPVSGTVGVSGTVSVDPSLPTSISIITAHQRATTSTTASGQTIVSHTVNTGFTYYLTGYQIEAYLTTPSATAARMGDVLVNIEGASRGQHSMINATTSEADRVAIMFPQPIPVPAGQLVSITTTPASSTSTAWIGNLYGYEK